MSVSFNENCLEVTKHMAGSWEIMGGGEKSVIWNNRGATGGFHLQIGHYLEFIRETSTKLRGKGKQMVPKKKPDRLEMHPRFFPMMNNKMNRPSYQDKKTQR